MKYLSVASLLLMLLSTGCTDARSGGPASSTIETMDNREEPVMYDFTEVEKITLNDSITHGLLYMREEEKLARDVYSVFARQYSHRVFINIARSEQRHMDAINILLVRYELQDPVGENAEGVFTNSDLQALYNDLITKGSVSLTDALLVGKLIEEVDIADLDIHLAELSQESDIARVYTNLRRASEQHLRAFTRNM